MVEWRIPMTYKIRFRGGPNHNKVIAYDAIPDIIVVPMAPDRRAFLSGMGDHYPAIVMRRGRYTRAIVPNKRGEYYYVWLGES
jgi:hypothetical protein